MANGKGRQHPSHGPGFLCLLLTGARKTKGQNSLRNRDGFRFCNHRYGGGNLGRQVLGQGVDRGKVGGSWTGRFCGGAFSTSTQRERWREFVFSLPEVLKLPCAWRFVLLLLLLLLLTVVIPLLERVSLSLDSALGSAARSSCAAKEAAASLYTRSRQEID